MRVCSIVLAALLGVSAPAATAQPADDRPDDLPLPERMERALRDMMEGVQPTLEDALDYLRSFGAVDDPRHYEMPEVLPNGDIIIRRRADAPELDAEPPDGPHDALPDGPGAPPVRDLPIDPEEGIRT
jgi:hypothetical protein